MERFFTLDKYNTWYDWGLIVTAKSVTPPEPNTNYVTLDGANGTLDLSEALAGHVTYKDRTVTATFWTDNGTRTDRERLVNKIISTLHGRKIKIVEPDDLDHYFYGRVSVTPEVNNLAYAEFTIKATCEPWRYAMTDSVRSVTVDGASDVVINNNGVKTLSPIVTVDGDISLTYNGIKTALTSGTFKITDFKLDPGVNVVTVSGNGSVSFTYKEALL